MAVEVLAIGCRLDPAFYLKDRAASGALIVDELVLQSVLTGFIRHPKHTKVFREVFQTTLILCIKTGRDVVVSLKNGGCSESDRAEIVKLCKEVREDIAVTCTAMRDDGTVDNDDWEVPNSLEGFANITFVQYKKEQDLRTEQVHKVLHRGLDGEMNAKETQQ